MDGGARSSRLAGRVALGDRRREGFGRAHALRLAALGADVAVVDIDLDAALREGRARPARPQLGR